MAEAVPLARPVCCACPELVPANRRSCAARTEGKLVIGMTRIWTDQNQAIRDLVCVIGAETGGKQLPSVLQNLAKRPHPLSLSEMGDEMFERVVLGMEALAHGLDNLTYNVASSEHVKQRLRQELETAPLDKEGRFD
jgi:cytochrome P450